MNSEISEKVWDWLRQKLKGMFSPLKGIMNDEMSSTHASSGYIKIIHVELLKSYADGVLEWDIDMRWNEPVRIYLAFNGESSVSAQTVKFFIMYHPFANTADDFFHIVSLGSGKFDIYANKEEYQIYGVRQVDTQTYMADRVSITYPMTFRSSAVSGWTDAINRCWNRWLVTGTTSTGLNVFENGVRRFKLEASINSLYARRYDESGTQTSMLHFSTVENHYNVGEVIITSTNTNPSATYGGTWELIDKEFEPKAWTSRTVSLNSTNCSACAVLSQHHGHTIELRITPTTKVALTDSTINIATFTLANFGVTGSWGGQERYWTQFSDAGNAIINWSFTSAGLLRSMDAWAISTSATHSVPASALSMFNVTLLIPQANMLDSWCNKFYWKRTA